LLLSLESGMGWSSTKDIEGNTYKVRWPTTKKESDKLKRYRGENKKKTLSNKAENWFCLRLLERFGLKYRGKKFNRQKSWGYRIFDFWHEPTGIVIELDGPSHNETKGKDAYYDKYFYWKSGIRVIRVRNFNKKDADRCLSEIESSLSWRQRRKKIKRISEGKEPLKAINVPPRKKVNKRRSKKKKSETQKGYEEVARKLNKTKNKVILRKKKC